LFPESCGALLQLANDLLNALGHHVASLILFGSALEKGCSKESDIDLLLIVYDLAESRGVDKITGEVMNIVNSYRTKGYMLSLNVLPLSEFMELLFEGNTMAVKIVSTGYPIIGGGLFKSLRRFVEKNPPAINRDQIIKSSVTLVATARALLESARGELFTACGYLKTVTGYLLAINTNIADPEKAINVADKKLGDIYTSLKSLCKRALKGITAPQELEEISRKLEELLEEHFKQK